MLCISSGSSLTLLNAWTKQPVAAPAQTGRLEPLVNHCPTGHPVHRLQRSYLPTAISPWQSACRATTADQQHLLRLRLSRTCESTLALRHQLGAQEFL